MPEPNASDVIRGLLGRAPMSPSELLKELNKADWPDRCYIHSLDFLTLAQLFPSLRDDEGLYFQIGSTQVRPAGKEGTLDLTDYQGPPLVKPWDEV